MGFEMTLAPRTGFTRCINGAYSLRSSQPTPSKTTPPFGHPSAEGNKNSPVRSATRFSPSPAPTRKIEQDVDQ